MKSSIYHLLIRCLGAALVLVGIVELSYRAFDIIESRSEWEFPFWDHAFTIQISAAILGAMLGFIFCRSGTERSNKIDEVSQFFNRMWLAFFIAHAGVSKILDTQFNLPEQIKDMPMMEVHPSALAWYFFSFSYEFGMVIGFIQAGGSFLLLFGRTRLLGAAVLLPVMLNIVLVNHYFHINPAAYVSAVILTTGILYVLLLDYKRLADVFLKFKRPEVRIIKNQELWKIAIAGMFFIAAIFLRFLVIDTENHTILKGVYMVETENEELFTKMYFEYHTTSFVTLEYGSHRNRIHVPYQLKESSDKLTIDIQGSTMELDYRVQDEKNLTFDGSYKDEPVRFTVRRVREATK